MQWGVARGAYGYEFEKFGIPFQTSRDRFIETLDAVRLLLSNEDSESSFHGYYVDFDDVYVWPRPVQRPHPPLLALLDVPPGRRWLTNDRLRDPRVLELMDRIELIGAEEPYAVRVELVDGTAVEADAGTPHGHPDNPVSDSDLAAKFDGLVRGRLAAQRPPRTRHSSGWTRVAT